MGTGSFPGVKCGRGVLLITHPLLVPRSWKSTSTHPLGHTGPVTGSLYLIYMYILYIVARIAHSVYGLWYGLDDPGFESRRGLWGPPCPHVITYRISAWGEGGKAAEVKNEWSYTSARICLHGLDRNNFIFLFFVMILLMTSLLSEAGYMIIPG